MNHLLKSAALTLCLAAPAAIALAGPPYQTDDPVPTDYRNYEIYVGTQEENSFGGIDAALPFAEVNYGLMPNVQFSMSAPFDYINAGPFSPGGWGVGAVEMGLKVRFIQESTTSPQVSIYPQIQMPTEHSNDTEKFFLPLWAQKTTGNTTVFGGGGWERNTGFDNENFWSGGIADTYQFSKVINAGVELYGNTAEVIGQRGSASLGVGMNDDFSEIHSIVVSIGASFMGERDLHAYAAYEFRLGPGEPGKE
jgi:hypothetical protein